QLEDTGLNRLLGSARDDDLYGGTGADFMFGNGGNDRYFRADGSTFESLDGGLLGDEWKEYAKQNSKVWYVGGTDADDVITVDYVTEPGLVSDYHLVTRLTNNNGNYTFSAQVRLDASGLDGDGNRVFDAIDATLDIEALEARAAAIAADPNNPDLALEEFNFQVVDLAERILPGEGAYDVILIDALGGNDQVYVGPTVQKTVWIDAGAGDDKVVISAGNAILVDGADRDKRNDTRDRARVIVGSAITTTTQVKGLTIDNPLDADWFRFVLESVPADAAIRLSSDSDLDGLALEIYNADGTPTGGTTTVQVSQDATDTGGSHDTVADAYELPAIGGLAQIIGLSLHDPSDVDIFKFTLPGTGRAEDVLGLIKNSATDQTTFELLDATGAKIADALTSGPLGLRLALDGLVAGVYYARVSTTGAPARYSLTARVATPNPANAEEESYLGTNTLNLSGRQQSVISLAGLTAGAEYLLRVSSPQQIPTRYEFTIDLGTPDEPDVVDFGNQNAVKRRDVILGGTGNDVLQGGAGEDWIFGGAGNDVLTGGLDRQAEDLLFGNEGDDTFQVIPDGPALLKSGQEALLTLTDRFDGGAGDDRVLFLGGDVDRLGQAVPDFVAIRYDIFLHRYEIGALEWDTANQEFTVKEEVLNATKTAPLNGKLTGDATFRVLLPGATAFTTLTLTAAQTGDNANITDLAADLQALFDSAPGIGAGKVTVEFPDGVLRFRATGTGFTLRAEAGNAAVTELGFSPLTDGAPIYTLLQAFYSAIDVERTVIDTRGGDDVVHADPEYMFPNVPSEWGIKEGNFEARALIGALEIRGGDGNDRLYGGAYNDTIDGGAGADVIMGFGGDDRITGGPAGDLLAGADVLEPDEYEFQTRDGLSARNDVSTFAATLPEVRQGTTLGGFTFHLGDQGDWYVISAPEALRQFGNAANAVLTGDMIEVVKVVDTGVLFQADENVKLEAYLFPAEDTDPGDGVTLVPRERLSGVPDYYLLHVLPDVKPTAALAGRALTFSSTSVSGNLPDVVNVGNRANLQMSETLTMEAWIKPTGPGGLPTEGGIIMNREGEYEVARFADGSIRWAFANTNPGWNWINTGYVAPTNEWTHIAVVYDRGLVQTYANGVLVHTFQGSGNIGDVAPAQNDFRIGGRQS
ncbi:MAG: hypothetical protein KIT73_16675, partial [Burkholderiales bacterium]|nr:hypothetical protein [Burkholderiales bacterium]